MSIDILYLNTSVHDFELIKVLKIILKFRD
jgi:hypothetical protein